MNSFQTHRTVAKREECWASEVAVSNPSAGGEVHVPYISLSLRRHAHTHTHTHTHTRTHARTHTRTHACRIGTRAYRQTDTDASVHVVSSIGVGSSDRYWLTVTISWVAMGACRTFERD